MRISLFVNHACNLSCTYCYNGTKFHRPMSQETALSAINQYVDSPNVCIGFFGGEPLMEYDLICRCIKDARDVAKQKAVDIGFSITTNGTLLTPEILATLKQEDFLLMISIDGNRMAHERTRPFTDNSSSYDVVTENVQLALDSIPEVETNSVIDPSNCDLIAESFNAIWDLGVRNMCFSYNHHAQWDKSQLDKLENGLNSLIDIYVQLYRKGHDFNLLNIDSHIRSHLKGGFSCNDRCNFGNGKICVSPSGNIYPCERLVGTDHNSELVIGHISTGIDLQKVMQMNSRKNALEPDCTECKLQHRCTYWCGCANFATTGDIGRTSGFYCHMEQLTIAAADRAAEILYRENNPLFLEKFYAKR